MARQIFTDCSAVTLTHPGANGVVGTGSDDTAYDLKADTFGLSMSLENVLVDAAGITSLAEIQEAQAASAMLEIRAKSTGTNAVKAQDLTAFTIGGTSYLGTLRDFTLGLSFTHDEGKGVGDKWLSPEVVGTGYSGEVTLLLDNAGANALQSLGFGSDAATALELAVAFTLNSVSFTFPLVLRSSRLNVERGQIQTLVGSFSGNGLESTSTGVASLLAAAVNEPRQWVEAVITSSDTNGTTYTGNFVHDSVSVRIADQQIVETTYRLRSQGVVTDS